MDKGIARHPPLNHAEGRRDVLRTYPPLRPGRDHHERRSLDHPRREEHDVEADQTEDWAREVARQIQESPLIGKSLLGAVDGADAVELVFADSDKNLLSIYHDGRVEAGYVDDAVAYAEAAKAKARSAPFW